MKALALFSQVSVRACLAAVALAGLLGSAATARASVTTFTNSLAFMNALTSPAYEEGFNDHAGDLVQGVQAFSLGYLGYTLTDLGSGYTYYSTGGAGQGSVFPTGLSYNDTFRIDFNGNVTAVGGTFFLSNASFLPLAGGNVTATLSTGESVVLASTGDYSTEPFGGFVSTAPIKSLTLSGTHLINGQGAYLTLDNLIVSGVKPVPEPASWAALGMGSLAFLRRRKRA